MTRSERLLGILQALRASRRPVTAAALALRFQVTARSIYRDIAALNAQGARIEGSPGVGYLLREGFFLPPLTFDAQEAAALLLGLRFVQRRGDAPLRAGAASAMGKLAAAVPSSFGDAARFDVPLLVAPAAGAAEQALASLRRALDQERVVQLDYCDAQGSVTARRIWPVAVGWFERLETVAAWCELRSAFRSFRVDRMVKVHVLDEPVPRPRRQLLAQYRKLEPGLEL